MDPDSRHPSATDKTVLVVDDEAEVRDALMRILRRAGYAVDAVSSGPQALEILGRRVVNLVLLDLQMLEMDGFETCRRVKAMEGCEELPVLILTGLDGSEIHEGAIAAGADDFLCKPVHPAELLMRVRSLLRIGTLVSELRTSLRLVNEQQTMLLKAQEERQRLHGFLMHDLKAPLSAITLQAELMIEHRGAEMDETLAWPRVHHHAEHIRQMILAWMDDYASEQAGLAPALARVEPAVLVMRLEESFRLRLQPGFEVKRHMRRVPSESFQHLIGRKLQNT